MEKTGLVCNTMPPYRSGPSRAKGCTKTGVSESLPQLPPVIGAPYDPVGIACFPTTDSAEGEDGVVADPPTAGTGDQLRAAASMDYASAQVRYSILESTTIELTCCQHKYQQRGGFNVSSQDRLRLLAGSSIYPQPLSTSSFSQTSFATEHSPGGQVSRSRTPEPSIRDFDRKTQEIIAYARVLVIDDMLTEVGWLHGDPLHMNIKENFHSACQQLEGSESLCRSHHDPPRLTSSQLSYTTNQSKK